MCQCNNGIGKLVYVYEVRVCRKTVAHPFIKIYFMSCWVAFCHSSSVYQIFLLLLKVKEANFYSTMTSLVSDVRIAPPDLSSASSNRKISRQGRRLVNAEGKEGKEKSVRPVDISDIDELQRILDRDADAIINMKRDITMAQNVEIQRVQDLLLKNQKAYDVIKISNKRKSAQLSELLDKERELERLAEVRGVQGSMGEDEVNTLKSKIAVIDEQLSANKRTYGVMSLMHSRIEAETEQLRSDSQVLTQQLEIKKAELLGLNITIRSSRQELLEEERRHEELLKLVKQRAQQRVEKMGQLQSLLMLNGSFLENSTAEDKNMVLTACDSSSVSLTVSIYIYIFTIG